VSSEEAASPLSESSKVWLTVADDLMVEALRPVKDGIATVAEVTEAMMKIL
jgi:hypothetical protein